MEKREELRLKMVKHQDEARKLRDKIATIDNISRKQQIEELVGKTYKTDYGWFRIERFDYKANRYYGTVITMFGKGKNKLAQIEFNETIHDSTLEEEKTKSISEFRFKQKLNECGNMIIKAMDYGKYGHR